MNKINVFLFAAATALIIVACGPKKEAKKGEEFVAKEAETEKPEEISVDPVAMGEALVKKSDCKTCHHPVNKLIGPAHTEVAKKYDFTEANVKILADKIIKGGVGVWGQVPMNPHPDISSADAEKMARYVLSLDGEKEH